MYHILHLAYLGWSIHFFFLEERRQGGAEGEEERENLKQVP